jgi:hypothetical protein
VPGGFAEKIFNATTQVDEPTAVLPALTAINSELQLTPIEIGARAGVSLIASSEPIGVLIVLNDEPDGELTVRWCHGAGSYNPPLGAVAGNYNGKTFLFIGDQIDGILPVTSKFRWLCLNAYIDNKDIAPVGNYT